MITAILAALLAGALPLAPTKCGPVPGAKDALSERNLKWLIVGEQHGTTETPAVFAELVCQASISRKTVVVALEYHVSEQKWIDHFIASDGGRAARSAFLTAPMWHGEMQDGRSSQAIFDLFERLRQLKAARKISSVVAVKPDQAPDPAAYEMLMAEKVRGASTSKRALVLVLVGNVHARKTLISRGARSYMPMAGWLSNTETMALAAFGNGGSQWACFLARDAPRGAQPICAARDFGPSEKQHLPGIVLELSPLSPYNGMLYLGVATTASRPQVSN